MQEPNQKSLAWLNSWNMELYSLIGYEMGVFGSVYLVGEDLIFTEGASIAHFAP